MGKVTGIGGVFFRTQGDRTTLGAWYQRHAGRGIRGRAMMQGRWAIPFFLVVMIHGEASGQAPAGVSGTLRLENGRPLVGAMVWATAGVSSRDTRTDSLGHFRISVTPGTFVLEVICPIQAFSLAVPVALRRSVTVTAGQEVDVGTTLKETACNPPPPRTVRVRWRGWYSTAFEESSFRPCATDTVAREVRGYGHPDGRHAWVLVSPAAWGRRTLDAVQGDPQTGGAAGFVEWSGVLHGPSPSGHMGSANYALTVDSIFSVSARGSCD
jgi:hypothetical protein